MTQVLLNVKNDEQLPFLMELLKRLEFIEVVPPTIPTKQQQYDETKATLHRSLNDVELHLQGKIKLPTLKEALDELRRDNHA